MMSFGFGGFDIMFTLMFCLVFAIFIVALVKVISQWNRNNHSPRLTVPALVVTKRTEVSHHHHHHAGNMGAMHVTTSTSHYVTFQVDSGDRMELCVTGSEYGQLAEGDRGMLTFQGTRYLSFDRDTNY